MTLLDNRASAYADRIVDEIMEIISPILHEWIARDYNPEVTSAITGADYIFYFKTYAVLLLLAAFFLGVAVYKYRKDIITILKVMVSAMISFMGFGISYIGFLLYHKRYPRREELHHIQSVWNVYF